MTEALSDAFVKQRADNITEIKKAALHLLTWREHSRLELRRKLLVKGFNDHVVDEVLLRLAEVDVQSDRRFTQSFIRSHINRGHGPIRITQELNQKGVSQTLIQGYCDVNDPMWLDHVKTVYRKKYGTNIPEDFNERMKRAKFLQYRGFTTEQIQSVINV